MMVAGEASGDMYGARLVSALRNLAPGIRFFGIGGPKMEEAEVRILYRVSELAVVGMTEVLPKMRFIHKALNELKDALKDNPPDLVILIDYPGFNLHLAKKAHDLGIPVLYYIPPQVWAWRERRVKKIAKRVDRIAVILPFEKEFYAGYGIKVEYVGHPLLDGLEERKGNERVRGHLGFGGRRFPVVGLLPGSRNEEIARHMPPMVGAAEIIARTYPDLRCMLPLAPTVSEETVKPYLKDVNFDVTLCSADTKEVLGDCDLALIASGTATLEGAITGTPMVILYKVSFLTFVITKLLAKVTHIGLVNLVAGGEIVPELIQGDATDSRLAEEGLRILEDEAMREDMRASLRMVRDQLGQGGASEKAAAIAGEMMGLGIEGE
ncbi:MAG: lipid-A-disaccharide synthase [Deltaproteobacteria bacterium]|nr:lipid-A-disaccharide synthase [Deltaproteobacteria bacterium]